MLAFIFCARISSLDRTEMLLALAIPASIAAMYVFGVAHMVQQYQPWMPDRRYFIYPIYFTFGMFVAKHESDSSKRWLALGGRDDRTIMVGRVSTNQSLPHGRSGGRAERCVYRCSGFLPLGPQVDRRRCPPISSVGRDSLFLLSLAPARLRSVGAAWALAAPSCWSLSLMSMVLFRATVVARRLRLRNMLRREAAAREVAGRPAPRARVPLDPRSRRSSRAVIRATLPHPDR